MNITRKLSLAVLALGFAASAIGCSVTPPAHASVSVSATPVATSTATASSENSPSAEPSVTQTPTATESKVETIAAVPTANAEPPAPSPAAVEEPVVDETPEPAAVAVPDVPAPATPVKAATPVQAAPAAPQAAPVQAAPAVSREVYVGLAGGQAVVDQQRGPVLFPLGGGFPPYVAEHDLAGGWARFGTLSPGMTVRMSGLVTGTYTVGQIINVPKGGSTDELRQFRTMPKVMLQTCVPGTKRMIIVGLY